MYIYFPASECIGVRPALSDKVCAPNKREVQPQSNTGFEATHSNFDHFDQGPREHSILGHYVNTSTFLCPIS